MDVCTKVVKKEWCIGCGVCAAVCPRGRLSMVFDGQGQYCVAGGGESCAATCSQCLRVCPFSGEGDDEDIIARSLYEAVPGITHRAETGYCLGSYVGFSRVDGHRANGASGGLATWLLQKLLNEKVVDHVLCVAPAKGAGKLFEYAVCSTAAEIQRCSRSCYYPVEVSEVLSHVLRNEGRYALTALPCVAKAVRLAQGQLPKLRERIRFVLGLTCGQGKNACFAEYACALGGGDPHDLREVTFRVKEAGRAADNFGLHFLCGENSSRQEGLIFWNDGIGRIWSHRYFTPYPCNFCDDVFAECADAVFLDAWLPPYVRDPAGHSIVLTRNPQLDGFLEQELRAPREVTVSRISLDDIVHSQQRVIQTKRGDLARRLAWAEELGMPVPPKRVRLLQGHRTFGRDLLIRACWKISQQSTAIWRRVDKNRQAFDEQMSVLRREADQARDHLIRYRRLNRLVHWLRSHLR